MHTFGVALAGLLGSTLWLMLLVATGFRFLAVGIGLLVILSLSSRA